MAISVSKKNPNYKSINASGFHDSKLSLKAKGLLVYLLMKPEGWKGQLFEIAGNNTDGKRSIQSALKELSDNGYAKMKSDYDKETRKFTGCYYTVFDEKQVIIPSTPPL